MEKFITAMLMLSPLVLLVLGLYFVYDMVTFSSHSIETVGIIAEIKREERYDSEEEETEILYTPVVEFKTEDKKTIKTAARELDNHPSWRINDLVRIRYDKDNPQNIRLSNSNTELFLACITLTLGSILAVILIRGRKRRIRCMDDYKVTGFFR